MPRRSERTIPWWSVTRFRRFEEGPLLPHKCSRVLHPVWGPGVESCVRAHRERAEEKASRKPVCSQFLSFHATPSPYCLVFFPLFFFSFSLHHCQPLLPLLPPPSYMSHGHPLFVFLPFFFIPTSDCERLVCLFCPFASATTALSLLSSTRHGFSRNKSRPRSVRYIKKFIACPLYGALL